MGTDSPVSAQQWAAISAPLEPGGRDRRGRLRQDHADGRAGRLPRGDRPGAPRRGPRPDLHHQGGQRAAAAGSATACARRPATAAAARPPDDEEVLEPTVATYNAYAAALLTEHGLRIGHEPDTRVIADASRYQLGRAGDRPVHRPGRAAQRPPRDRRPVPPRPRRRDERAPRRRPHGVRDFQRRRAGRLRGGAARPPGHRATIEKALDTLDRRERAARPGRDLPPAQGRPRADGLLRPDRAGAPGSPSEHPEVGAPGAREVQGRAARRVPGHLGRPGPDAAPALLRAPASAGGRGHAVTAVGDPNQAIYGWRGASVSNILDFAARLPGRRRLAGRPDVPADREPPLRRAHPRRRQPAGRPAATRSTRRSRRSSPPSGRRRRARSRRSCLRDATPTSWPGSPSAVARPRTTMTEPSWREIGVLTRDNATRGRRLRRAHRGRHPGRDRRPPGPAAAARGRRGRRDADLLHDLTANAALLTLLTGPRWAIGPRDLRAARPPRPRARRPAASDAPAQPPGRRPARRDRRRRRPDRGPLAVRRARRPGRRRRYSAEALERFALLSAELRTLRTHVGRAAARPGPPDHRHHRHRRRARVLGQPGRAAPGATTSTCSSKAVAEFQAVDGDGQPAGAAGLPDRRGRAGQRPRRRHPDRGRLGQAADGAPRQGPGVGRGLPASASARRSSRPPAPARCGPTGPPCCPPRCAGTPPTCRSCAGTSKADLDAFTGRLAHARGAGGAAARVRRLHPGRGTCSRSRPTSGTSPARPRSAPRRTRWRWSRHCAAGALEPDAVGGEAREGHGQPAAAGVASAPWPVDRAHGRGAAPPRRGRGGPRGDGAARRRRAGEPELDMVEAAGSPTGTASSTGCSPRRAATARTGSRCRCRRACRPPRWPGCATTPTTSPATWPGRCRASRRRPPGSAPASTPGWRRASASRTSSTPTSCPGRGDGGIDYESDLAALVATFEAGPFAERAPVAVEAPFALVLGGQVVRGRIDAVYADRVDGEDGFLVVDWKTNQRASADAAPARPLPPGLGRPARRPGRARPRGVLLRAHRRGRRARGPPGARRDRGAAHGGRQRLSSSRSRRAFRTAWPSPSLLKYA